MALTSFGDYHYSQGVGWWENCIGSCSWLKLVKQSKVALGHNVFAEARIDPCEKAHELVHVRQSNEHGSTWLIDYLSENIRKGYSQNRFEIEAYAAQARCEAEGGTSYGPYTSVGGGPSKE